MQLTPVSPAGRSVAGLDVGAPTLSPSAELTAAALGQARCTAAAAVGVAVGAAVGADVEDAAVGVDAGPEGLELPQAARARVPRPSASTGSAEERLCIAPVYPQSGQALHTLWLRRGRSGVHKNRRCLASITRPTLGRRHSASKG